MNTNNNELLGKNLTDLISTPEDAQGFTNLESATAEEILNPEQVPPKKAEQQEPYKPAKLVEGNSSPTDPPTGKPVKVEAGLLSDIRNSVIDKVQSAQNQYMNFNLDDYAKYMGNNPGIIGPREREDHTRAVNQTATEQFKHAVGQVGVNIIPEIVSQLANIFDIEDYNNSDAEIGNFVQRWADSVKADSSESMPIYETDPGKALNVKDSGWWFKNGSGLVTSAAAFAVTGYAAAGLTSFASLRGAKALKWATTLGQDASLSAKSMGALNKINTLATAYMLNQAEGLGIGVDTYNNAYKKYLEELKAKDVDGTMSSEDIDTKAKELAAQEGASAINFNKWNFLLNITSANMFLKSPATTRALLKKNTGIQTAKEVLREGGQEYIEENVNDIAQQQAETRDYGFKDAMGHVLSMEGLESGLLGFAGGAGQTALTKAGKYIPMYKNKEYFDAYRDAYSKAPRDMGDVEKDAFARELASEVAFSTKDRVSENDRFNAKYAKQQEVLDLYEANSNLDNVNDVAKNLANADFMLSLMNELEQAEGLGQAEKERTLKRLALGQMARNAFESGTTESLINMYESYANLTHDEAEERGMYKKGDENKKDYYKAKAKSIISDIEYLEDQYVKSKEYVNSNEVYNLNEISHNLDKDIKMNTEHTETMFQAAETLFADNPDLHPGQNGEYRDSSTKTGYNLIKVNPAFRGTSSYESIKEMNNTITRLKNLKKNITKKTQKITTRKYQEDLKKKIDSIRKAQAKNVEAEEAFARHESKKEDNRSNVRKLRDAFSKKKEEEIATVEEAEVAPVPVSNTESTEEVPTSTPTPTTFPVSNTEEVNPEPNKATTPTPDANSRATFSERLIDVDWSGIEVFSTELKSLIDSTSATVSQSMNNPKMSLEMKVLGLRKLSDNLKNNRDAFTSRYPTDPNAIDQLLAAYDTAIESLKDERNNIRNNANSGKHSRRSFIEALESEGQVPPEVASDKSAANRPDYSKSMRMMERLANELATLVEEGIEESDFVSIIKAFEEATDKARVIIQFPKIKALYNAVNQSGVTIEGSYEEVMYGRKELEDAVNRVDNIAKFHKPTETYTSDLDTKSQELLNMYETLAQFNGYTAENTGIGFEIYNNTARNKVAYLAKEYTEAFSYKTTKGSKDKPGIKYVAVTKMDIDNIINNLLDQRVLSLHTLVKGKAIQFVPLDQVTLEDGNIRHSDGNTYNANGELIEKGDGAGTSPIGIMVDGKLLDKAYLHDTTWINATNLDSTSGSILRDRKKLKAFKQAIIDKGSFDTVITYRSGGVPILDNSGIKMTVAERTPNVTVGVVRGGQVEIGDNKKMNPKNVAFFKEGKSVIVIPHGEANKSRSNFLALPVNNSKLYPEYIESIISAVRTYLIGEATEDALDIEKKTEYNLLNINGLTAYINNFISLRGVGETHTKINNFKDFSNALATYEDNANLVQITGSQIFYGRGTGINTNSIGTSKYKNRPNAVELIEKDLTYFRYFLKNVYSHVNITNLGKKVPLPILNDGKIEKIHTDYTGFVKENLMSQYLSMKLDSGEEIYTVQSIIRFKTGDEEIETVEESYNEEESEAEVEVEVAEVEEEEPLDTDNDPDLDISDITDFALSPATILPDANSTNDAITFDNSSAIINDVFTEEFNKELRGAYSFIEGVTIGDKQSIVKTIVNNYYKDILAASTSDIEILPLREQVGKVLADLNRLASKMQAQLDMKDNPNLKKGNFSQLASHIVKQASIISANKDIILEDVKRAVSRKKNTKSEETDIENGENNEDTQDEEVTNTKSILYDVSEYSIDPKSGLSDAVRYMLESVREYTVVEKKDNMGKVISRETKPRTNALKLHSYVAVNTTFEALKSILSKNNEHYGLTIESDINHEEDYKEGTPNYIKYIVTKLRENVKGKPYLIDVIDILKEATPQVQNQFATNFNGHATNHIFLLSDYNKKEGKREIRRTVAATRNTSALVLSEWQNNLYYKNLIKLHEGKRVLSIKAVRDFAELFKAIATNEISMTHENVNRVFDEIGVSIPEGLYNSLYFDGYKKMGKEFHIFQMFTERGGLFRNIYDRVMAFRTDKPNYLDLEVSNLFENSAFRDLSYLVSKYRKDLTTNSFRNGNGDTIYGFSNSRYAPDRLLRLKSNAALLTGLNNDPFSSNSLWLKGLTNKDEFGNISVNTDSRVYQYLKYYTSDSLKIKGMDSLIRGKTVDNLSPRDLERYHFGLFMNNGMYVDKASDPTPIMNVVYPTMEEKSNTFVIQVPGKYIKLTANGNISDSTKEYLVDNLLQPEINRILAFQNGNRPDVLEMEKGGNMSILFPALHDTILVGGNEATKEINLFDELGKLDEAVLTDALLREALKVVVTNYIKDMYHQKMKDWESYGIVLEDINGEKSIKYMDGNYKEMMDAVSVTKSEHKLKELAYNYIINTSVAHMNIQQLFIGDPALFSETKFKKDSNLTDSQNAVNFAIATSAKQVKRLSGHNGSKQEFNADINEKMGVLIVKDAKMVSTSIDYIESLITATGAEGYKNLTAADAQELTTLEEHLRRMTKEGDIDEEVADRILTNYNKTGRVESGDIKLIIQPYKPVYFNNFEKDGKMINFYIKSSSYPLISSFTKGKPLDALRELMENKENGIDTTAFESAVKLGKPVSIPNIFNVDANGITDGTITIPEDWRKGYMIIPREGHGNQQKNPYDASVKEVNDGSQQAKLAFTNLLEVEGFIDPDTGETVKGRQLAKKYLDLYQEMYLNKYNKLIKKLGYDPSTGTITNFSKLSKMLKNEGLGRNYSYNDVKGFALNATATDFQVPLWAGNSAVKVEALLSSIVDNQVRKRKVRGKSLILASPAGVNTTSNVGTIEDVELSDVVRVGNWDGNIKAGYKGVDENGKDVMVSAEVLVPFKFWDNNGKPLKLVDFLKEDVTLDMSKLPENILELFSYRIPTSGINLMSNIKIVGFLPEKYGDMIIAPPDFIEQMGSDFDVDKLYTHMYNTSYDFITGKLVKITSDNAKKIGEEQEKRKGEINTIMNNISALEEKIAEMEESPLKEREKEKLLNWQDSVETERAADILALGDVREAVIQNSLLDIHRAVLNNPSDIVQAARVRTISFGQLPKFAKIISAGKDVKYFTPISQIQQSKFYTSARSGKTAVGVFSLNMVFNSVVQYVEGPMFFREGKEKDYAKYIVNIAGRTSNDVNSIYVAGSETRYKSEEIEGFMTSALDNGNEQLLGKLNINSYTFDFIRAALQIGFDQETVLTIINQPAIIDYVEKKENRSVMLPIEEFEEENRTLIQNTSMAEFQANFNSLDVESDLQKAVLSLFDSISDKGRILKTAQSAINSDSAGIGKNLFYNSKKIQQIIELPFIGLVGAGQLIGDYTSIKEITEQLQKENLDVAEFKTRLDKTIKEYEEEEGYVRYENTLIRPKTLGGFAAVYATLTNGKMWQKFFPYQNDKIMGTLNTVLNNKTTRSTSVNASANDTSNIFKHFKSFLISDTYNLFGDYGSINSARSKLLYSTPDKMDLGSIIFDLRQSRKYTNLLLDGFEIGERNSVVDVSGLTPNSLSYFNAGVVEENEDVLGSIIVDMLTNEKDLGEYNGKMVTTRTLMNDIITHQMINGGIQRGSQIIKYLPYEYLKKLGYYNKLTEGLNNASTTAVTTLRKRFLEQYMQHFPNEFYDKKVSDDFVERVEGTKILLKEGEVPTRTYIVINPAGEQFDLYKFNEETQEYEQLDNLGYKTNTEFDLNAERATSMTEFNQAGFVVNDLDDGSVEEGEVKEDEDLSVATIGEKLYNKLGKKTKSPRVIIKSIFQQEGVKYAKQNNAVFSLRVDDVPFHFGNPFSSVDAEIEKGLTATDSTKESVEQYIDWVLTSTEDRAKWIRNQLESKELVGKQIIYYKELGEPSHATALDYLINVYARTKGVEIKKEPITIPNVPTKEKTNESNTRQALLKTLFTRSTEEGVVKGSVVKYKDKQWIVWNINDKNKVQLISSEGTKFSGTPNVENVTPIGYYTTTVFNGTDYVVTGNEKVYSLATGSLVYENLDNSTKMQKERIINQIMEENGLENNNATESNSSAIVASNESIPTIDETPNFLRVDRDTTSDISSTIHKQDKQDLINQFYLDEENLSIEDKNRLILDEIADSSKDPILSHFAHVLKDVIYLLNDTPIVIDYTLNSRGIANSNKITGESMSIFINPNLINTAEEMREVLIEEIIHGITKKSINDFNDGRPSKGNPIKVLDSIRQELITKVKTQYGEEKWNSTIAKIGKGSPLNRGVEADLIYSLHNLEEFIAAAIKNPDFKTYLNNTKASDTTKSLWEKFITAIKDMLVALGVRQGNNLEVVLDNTLRIFDSIERKKVTGLNRPKYYRSANYLNSKFNLVNSSSSPIVKGNPNQIANYINNHIVNVRAVVVDEKVILKPLVSVSIASDMAAILEDGEGESIHDAIYDTYYEGEAGGLKNAEVYIMSINDRINKLESNQSEARNNKDFKRVEELDILIAKEAEKREDVYNIASVAALADEARKDFEIVENILKRDMNVEDVRYVKYIVNFWKDSMYHVFNEEHYTSTALTSVYGKIQGKAKALDLRLSKIEKSIGVAFIKKHTNATVDLDEIFRRYQDIGWAKADWRSISTVDNALIVSNWAAMQNANIDTRQEVDELLGDWDAELAKVVPILKRFNNKNLFAPFIQYSERGKNTNHIIRPYTDDFYKDKGAKINSIYKDKTALSMNEYMEWVRGTGEAIDLNVLYPPNKVVTSETIKAREEFKAKIGQTRYNYWEKEQEKVLEEYNSRRKAKLDSILEEFGIAKASELGSSPDAEIRYRNWTTRNSPYVLSSNINKGLTFKTSVYAFNSQRYYIPIPSSEQYLDARFKTIENNPELLQFYDKMSNILSQLEQYVPQEQKRSIAYGGLPSVEKSLIEIFNEKGAQVGFAPIMEALIKSTQTSYTSDAKSELDISTGKNKKALRIPLIKNPYEEVADYRKIKQAEYIAKYGKVPSTSILKEFEEDAIDEIASRHSLDLGKVIKMYTSLVIGLKHKAKIEDYIKNNNTILDSYQEVKRRPDGEAQQLGSTGEDALLDANDSYTRTKKMNENFQNNVLYGDSRDEQGKGKKVMTPSEKAREKDLIKAQNDLNKRKLEGTILNDDYDTAMHLIDIQLGKLGKTMIYSKVGDSLLKGIQLKVMGWNLLGGISNLGFGWIANQIEAAGGKTITKKGLAEGYRIALLSSSVEGKKADKMMKAMDVLQEASYELQTSSTRGEAGKKVKPFEPFMITKVTEGINQKPIMVALAKNFKVTTNQGEMYLWQALDTDGKWKTELGDRPDAEIKRFQLKLITLIGRVHGNYDALSPLAGKRTIFGRAASQFRGWLPEAIAARFEDYREDVIQGEEMKGRYRSVATMFSNTSKKDFASNLIKGFLRQWSFGKMYKNHDFTNLVDGKNIRDIDATNMRKVSMELVIALNLNLFLLLIASMFAGDDDEENTAYNILFNQGTRMRTDLMLYINPMEARNIIKDVIPAMSLVKDITDWNGAVYRALKGEDTIETGVNADESRLLNATAKNFPLWGKIKSIENASSQIFDKTVN